MTHKEEAVKRVEAIEFAEYLSLNHWVKREKTHPNYVGKYWSDLHCKYKTIEELYTMFNPNKKFNCKFCGAVDEDLCLCV